MARPSTRKPTPRKKAAAKKAAPKKKAQVKRATAKKSPKDKARRPANYIPQEVPFGRPTKYSPDCLPLVRAMCTIGATDPELARELGVSKGTIWNWTVHYPEFAEAIKIGKGAFDDRVERSLANRAIGYTYDEEKVFCSMGQIVTHAVEKHVPPDVGAAQWWLSHRRNKDWSDTSKHEVTGAGGGPIQVEDTRSEMEVARRIAFMLAKAGQQAKVIEHSE